MSKQDNILPQLLRDKSRDLIPHIQKNYAGALFGVIYKVVNDRDLAEDVLQESLVKIWKYAQQYDESKGRPYTWMVNICRNAGIDTLRSKGFKMSRRIHPEGDSVLYKESDSAGGLNPDTMDVRSFPEKLRPEYKVVIEMLYFEGYTQKEVAEELDIPLGTIKTRTRAALKELREFLQSER